MLAGLTEVAWGELRHAYGEASDVPAQLRALLSPVETERQGALRALYGNIYHQGDRYSASVHALPFLLALVLEPSTPARAAILLLVTRLVAGDWTVRNGQTIHDGDRVLFFGEPVDRERAQEEGPRVWKACYDAAAPSVPLVLDLLDSDDPSLRISAAWFLGCFRDQALDIAPRLLTRIEQDSYIDVRAVALFSLHALHGPRYDAVAALTALHSTLTGWDAVMAAFGLVSLQPHQAPQPVVETLLQGLAWALDKADGVAFYTGCPFGDDLAGDIGHLVGRLHHQQAKALLEPLLRRLAEPLSLLATLGVTRGILRAALADKHTGAPLKDRERVGLAALFYCADIWKVTNNSWTFSSYQLPSSRGAMGQLLGLEPSDDEKGRATYDAAAECTNAQGLAKALPLFEEVLRLRPQQAASWANAAAALRANERMVEALELYQRGMDVFTNFQPLHSEHLLTLLELGRYEEAVAAASAWLARHDDAQVLFNRACALAKLQQNEAAVADLARCVALDSSYFQDLAQDPDLHTLRSRSDFQDMLSTRPVA